MSVSLFWVLTSLATLGSAAFNVTPASVDLVGQLNNPGITRDSCNSVAFGDLGVLWTCRDSQPVEDDKAKLPVVVNTASWSARGVSCCNALNLNTPPLKEPFYPLSSDECGANVAGMCDNSTRWVAWPNTGPMVVYNENGLTAAYSWIPKQNLHGLTVENQAYHSLYRLSYYSDHGATLPTVSLAHDAWWGSEDIGYGTYDTLVDGQWGYLFGQTPDGTMTLARVNLTDPLTNVENASMYDYWVNGNWTKNKPNKNQNNLGVDDNMYGGGQGTFYYSKLWNSYVWVGGSKYPGCTFYMTTAPEITGPWTKHDDPIYTGCNNGNGTFGAYSLLAHPDLSAGDGTDLYLTWTITNEQGLYQNLLAHVIWQ